jgi:hypothetical protein
MDRLGSLAGPSGAEALDGEHPILQGQVAEVSGQMLTVRLPGYAASQTFGPMRWNPVAKVGGGTYTPEREDPCVVGLDAVDDPVLLQWWPQLSRMA